MTFIVVVVVVVVVVVPRSVAAGFGGSADIVCPRWTLMTQVQHWAKTAQSDCVTLQPWRSWRLWLMRVVLRMHTKFEVHRPCCSEDMAHDVCEH